MEIKNSIDSNLSLPYDENTGRTIGEAKPAALIDSKEVGRILGGISPRRAVRLLKLHNIPQGAFRGGRNTAFKYSRKQVEQLALKVAHKVHS